MNPRSSCLRAQFPSACETRQSTSIAATSTARQDGKNNIAGKLGGYGNPFSFDSQQLPWNLDVSRRLARGRPSNEGRVDSVSPRHPWVLTRHHPATPRFHTRRNPGNDRAGRKISRDASRRVAPLNAVCLALEVLTEASSAGARSHQTRRSMCVLDYGRLG